MNRLDRLPADPVMAARLVMEARMGQLAYGWLEDYVIAASPRDRLRDVLGSWVLARGVDWAGVAGVNPSLSELSVGPFRDVRARVIWHELVNVELDLLDFEKLSSVMEWAMLALDFVLGSTLEISDADKRYVLRRFEPAGFRALPAANQPHRTDRAYARQVIGRFLAWLQEGQPNNIASACQMTLAQWRAVRPGLYGSRLGS